MPKTREAELEILAFQLYSEGKSIDEIGSCIGRSYTQTKQYVFQGGVRFEEKDNPQSLYHLNLDTRTRNTLLRAKVDSIALLTSLFTNDPFALMRIRNFGAYAHQRTLSALRDGGYLPSEKAKHYAE